MTETVAPREQQARQPLRVSAALTRLSHEAGIGPVTPHQLRHTLATQATNRGMSIDAFAALLGHKTLAMTMIYARIADKTVAEEYFNVTEKVEARYGQSQRLPHDDEGSEMRKLRAEMHPSDARQRPLRPTSRHRLPLRIDLRGMHLLRHHHRVQAHPSSSTRRSAERGPSRSEEDLRRPTPATRQRGHMIR
ncbi:MAG: tyrosine-type recombinase/integrase, partial [Pseudonocardiales bacterium]